MDEAVRLWFEFAQADLNTASFLYEKQNPRQLEIICYHCQQAGEKALKALYLAKKSPEAFHVSMICGSCLTR